MSLSSWLLNRWHRGDAGAVASWSSKQLAKLIQRRVRRRVIDRQLTPPVVVVGNISVGGAGKTPLVLGLLQAFAKQNIRAAVVLRGYGGTEVGPVQVPADDWDALRFGDEACLYAMRSDVPVVVAKKRQEGVAWLRSNHDLDVIVSDDGMQHYAMPRSLELAVIDPVRGLGNGLLMPFGPLREPPSRLLACDMVLAGVPEGMTWHGRLPHMPKPLDVLPYRLSLQDAWCLVDGLKSATRRPLSAFKGSPVHAVAGIGRPDKFFEALKAHGVQVVPHAFPDHHKYQPSDVQFDDDLPVLMTEKDAVKCRAWAQPNHFVVPLEAAIPDTLMDLVMNVMNPS